MAAAGFIPFPFVLGQQQAGGCTLINWIKMKRMVMENLVKEMMVKVSEVELVYKSKIKASERPQVSSSGDAFHILLDCWEEGKIGLAEQFKVLLLNRANKVLGLYHLSTGGVTATVADIRLIFAAALKANATGIILAHNHPSGNLTPSSQDKDMTARSKAAGLLLDIAVLDHLIVHSEGYYSFADEGLL